MLLPRWTTPAQWSQPTPRPVVMVTTSWPSTANPTAGIFVRNLAERLVVEGHRVTVVTPAGPTTAEPPGCRVDSGVVVRRAPWPGWRSGLFHTYGIPEQLEQRTASMLGRLTLAAASLAGEALHATGDNSVVVGHWLAPGGLIACAVSQLRRDALGVVVCHSTALRSVAAWPPVVARLALFWVPHCRVITTCQELADIVVGIVGRQAIAPDVMPMPRPKPHRLGSPPPGPPWRLLTLGRLVPIKGLHPLLTALAARNDVELHIAGDGPLRAELESVAATMRRPAIFHGLVQGHDKQRLLSEVHGFVHPSLSGDNRAEGMPTSVLEALDYNLPVLATPSGGVAELSPHPLVMLCPPNELNAGIDKLVTTLQNGTVTTTATR